MTRLGQHFLRNATIAKKIVDAAVVSDGDFIIEVGPGHGELTAEILSRKGEFTLISIEKDENLFQSLKERFKEDDRFSLAEGDALETLPNLVSKLTKTKAAHLKILGNIPYYITGHLMRIVGDLSVKPEKTIFMIQKEVAERAVAQPPSMNRLSASIQFWADASIIVSVPRKNFMPPPNVDSAVILLDAKRESVCDKDGYYSVMRAIFSQPRKTLLNNLAHDPSVAAAFGKKEDIVEILTALSVRPDARPQDLSVADIAIIAQEFSKRA